MNMKSLVFQPPSSVTLDDVALALGITKRSVERRAKKESWEFSEETRKGGKKRLYSIAHMPLVVSEAVRIYLLLNKESSADSNDSVRHPVVDAPGVPMRSVDAEAMTKSQLDCERARDRILDFVAAYPRAVSHALDFLNSEYQKGSLPAPLKWAMDNAWDKRRSDTRLTARTYHNWVNVKRKKGRSAPSRIQKDMAVKPWYGLLYELLQRPQGSCFTWISEQIKNNWTPAWGKAPPSYDTVRRVAREKFSVIDTLKGRYTGSKLRSHKLWKPRVSDGLMPWQEIHADGWNTHFTAPHPVSGEFVTYEVWHFHDPATRFVPLPGIGLTETYEVITAGLERCVRVGGIPAILQTDSTKVVRNSPRFTSDPVASLAERAGFTVVHPVEVGNSQANGICENFNTWLDKQSRELATYQGKGMDSLTLKRVKKITEKMVKAGKAGDIAERDRLRLEAEKTGKGRVFASYAEAEAWINATVDSWNDKPHRSLKKIADPVTGKKRHQTPREALKEHLDAGWQPYMLTEDQIIDLFRPHVRCKVTREAVSPVGNGQRYTFPGLGAWNGQEVLVAVDPMDWQTVSVKTLDGALIAAAHLVSATGYRALAQYEIAEEKRAKAQLRRNAKKRDHIIETRTSIAIPSAPASEQIIVAGRTIETKELVSIGQDIVDADFVSKPAPTPFIPRSERPAIENYPDWQSVGDAMARGDEVSEADRMFYLSWPNSSQGKAHLRKLGINVEELLHV